MPSHLPPPQPQLEPVERYHPRVEANFMVKVIADSRTFMARAQDLSMAGLFLVGNPPLGRNCFVLEIPLPGDREVVTGCQIRRRTAQGAAVEFDELDWDDLFALARFLHPRLPDE